MTRSRATTLHFIAESYQISAINTYASYQYPCQYFFSRVSSSISRIISLMPRHSENNQVQLMKERRCFSCKKRSHTAYDCRKKRKIIFISEGVSESSDS